MNKGNGFGRRNSRQLNAASDAHRSDPDETVDGASGDPVKTTVLLSVGTIVVFAAAIIGAWVTRPAAPPTVAKIESRQNVARDSKVAALPDADADEPSSTPSSDDEQKDAAAPEDKQESNGSGLAGNGKVAEKQRKAALTFFGFYHLNTRARTAHCGQLGVDMADFVAKFRQSQRGAYSKATAIATAAGLTEDQIYAESRGELMVLIQKDIDTLGQKTGMGPKGGCTMMVQFADKLIPSIDFAKVMPEAHSALMGS